MTEIDNMKEEPKEIEKLQEEPVIDETEDDNKTEPATETTDVQRSLNEAGEEESDTAPMEDAEKEGEEVTTPVEEDTTPVEDVGEEKEEVTVSVEEDVVPTEDAEGEEEADIKTMEDIEDTFVTVRPGKVVKGSVIQVGENEVIVNIGYKADGIITKDELSNDPSLEPSEVVKVGDEIEVFIKRIDEKEGSVSLSKKKVDIERAWKDLKDKHETGEAVNAKVLEEVKGGLIAIAEGIKGFVPASHIDINYVEVLRDFVGQELSMKVIEFNRSKGKVIFSRKSLLEDEREEKKKEVLATIKAGDRIKGEVKRLTGFGAFVDVGGIDGLVHISEISWNRIGHPSEVLEAGQIIEVLVLGVEPDNERISLSLKQTTPHPWDNIEERYAAGDIIGGKIVRLVDFGAFVELEPGVEGLVHISQIAYEHVEKPQDVLEEGQEVKVKVLDLKPKDRRISLSIKETIEKPVKDENKNVPRSQPVLGEDQQPITIGDLVGDIFNESE